MTKATDTTLEKHQENLVQMIVTYGNLQETSTYWEVRNILPLVKANDQAAFLLKYKTEYKERLQMLLKKIFWALPPEQELPLADKFLDDLQSLIEKLADDLSKQKR